MAGCRECITRWRKPKIIEKRLEYIGALQKREKKIGLCSNDLGTIPKTRLGHACRSGQLGSVTSKPNYGGASAKAPFAPREDDTSLLVYAKSFVNLRSKKLANSLS